MKVNGFEINYSDAEKNDFQKYAKDIIDSGNIVAGKYTAMMEQSVKDMFGYKHCIAVASGSVGLEMVARWVSIGLNSKFKLAYIPTNTFIGTAKSVEKSGWRINFTEMEERYFGMKLKQPLKGKNILMVPVHVGGYVNPDVVNMNTDFTVLEDCAHAFGSKTVKNGREYVAGELGLAGVFSFFATKVITGGEGGLIVTENDELAKWCRIARNYGKPDKWVSITKQEGYNWRITEFASALILSQLNHYERIFDERNSIAKYYFDNITDKRIELVQAEGESLYYKLVCKTRAKSTWWKDWMEKNGITLPGNVYDVPLHRQEVYKKGYFEEGFPVANKFCSHHICLPIWRGMEERDMEYVAMKINEGLGLEDEEISNTK